MLSPFYCDVVTCAVSSVTNVHVSSNQSLTHGQSLSCFCEIEHFVDELTSFTVTCQRDGVADMFRVDRQTCESAVHFSCWPSNVHSKRNESQCLEMCICNRP